jgi:hypothetical protein
MKWNGADHLNAVSERTVSAHWQSVNILAVKYHLARTVAAGPRELLKEEPRIDWTVDNVVDVRN